MLSMSVKKRKLKIFLAAFFILLSNNVAYLLKNVKIKQNFIYTIRGNGYYAHIPAYKMM